MSSELSLLIPEFRKAVITLIDNCKSHNVRIEVLLTVVSPLEQAVLWKAGRTATDAELKALALEKAGAPYLALVMRQAQPHGTNKVTEALPGLSWHQWGEAVTCVWVDKTNRLNWSPYHKEGNYNINGYRTLAEETPMVGLTHGTSFGDSDEFWAYVQLRAPRFPSDVYSLGEIDAEMKRRFSR